MQRGLVEAARPRGTVKPPNSHVFWRLQDEIRTFFLASTVSVLSLLTTAQAQEVFELNRIVIGMGTDGEDANAGENAVDVTDEDLARTNPADLQDLFASEPTIAVGSSLPISQKLYVNGVEETNLSVTIDGSRQNNKIFHHSATTLIDPSLLKAVSIEPGIAPADAGPGALAGAVQYETRDARDLLEDGKSFGGFTLNEFGTNGEVFTTSNALYGLVDGFEFLGFVKYANGGLQEDGDGVTINGSGTQILSGLGKVAYQSAEGHRLEFSYERVADDEARPYRANIGQIIGGRPVPLTRNYDMTRQNVALTYTNEAPTGLWDPTIQLSYSITNLDIEETTQNTYGQTDSLNGKIEKPLRAGQWLHHRRRRFLFRHRRHRLPGAGQQRLRLYRHREDLQHRRLCTGPARIDRPVPHFLRRPRGFPALHRSQWLFDRCVGPVRQPLCRI